MQENIRTCGFAGRFFPNEKNQLTKIVAGFLEQASNKIPNDLPPTMGIISPHAGYRFSGEIAALAYYAAKQNNKNLKRIIILSPSHRHKFDGVALPSQNSFSSPMGESEICSKTKAELVKKKCVKILDEAHDNEHGIETQLPFIQYLWSEIKIVPLVVGNASDEDLKKIFEYFHKTVLNGEDLIVISSDLSHFLEDASAQRLDAKTAQFIETFNHHKIRADNACGYRPLRSFLDHMNIHGFRATRLGMYNSSKTSGDKSRVVGYGAWHFVQNDYVKTPQDLREKLLIGAEQSLKYFLKNNKRPKVFASTFHPILNSYAATFVSLKNNGKLRGCIGSISPQHSLIESTCQNAISAGFNDKRFSPITLKELPELEISVSILSSASKLFFENEKDLVSKIVPHKQGLILATPKHRGVFLPVVWESLNEVENFWQNLKLKAGLQKDFWSDEIKVYSFQAENFTNKRSQ